MFLPVFLPTHTNFIAIPPIKNYRVYLTEFNVKLMIFLEYDIHL